MTKSDKASSRKGAYRINAKPLKPEQIDLLQAFIDEAKCDEYEAMDIIPEEYLEYFAEPKTHGKQFKHAVEGDKLRSIKLGRFDMGDKHWRYNLHGWTAPLDDI